MVAPYSGLLHQRIAKVKRGKRKTDVSRCWNISQYLDLWLKRAAQTGDCRAITTRFFADIKLLTGNDARVCSTAWDKTSGADEIVGDNVSQQNIKDVQKIGFSRKKTGIENEVTTSSAKCSGTIEGETAHQPACGWRAR